MPQGPESESEHSPFGSQTQKTQKGTRIRQAESRMEYVAQVSAWQ
jgi:hypothetical protein